MTALLKTALMLCWLVLLAYWGWSALHAKPVARNESRHKQLLAYWLPLGIAVFLLGPGRWFGHSWLREQFVPHSTLVFTIALLLAVAGTVVAIWARPPTRPQLERQCADQAGAHLDHQRAVPLGAASDL